MDGECSVVLNGNEFHILYPFFKRKGFQRQLLYKSSSFFFFFLHFYMLMSTNKKKRKKRERKACGRGERFCLLKTFSHVHPGVYAAVKTDCRDIFRKYKVTCLASAA